jgi:hypothetical protein
VLNLVTDVTEQRRMEDELRNYAKVAAHDLREPIMAAGYLMELLARRLANGRTAENEELLERVRQTHARARSLVDGVLECARSGTSLAADPVDDASWLYSVRDNGVGVPPELGRRDLFYVQARARRGDSRLRHWPRRLPQDRRGARRRYLGRARRRLRYRDALHRSRPLAPELKTTAPRTSLRMAAARPRRLETNAPAIAAECRNSTIWALSRDGGEALGSVLLVQSRRT